MRVRLWRVISFVNVRKHIVSTLQQLNEHQRRSLRNHLRCNWSLLRLYDHQLANFRSVWRNQVTNLLHCRFLGLLLHFILVRVGYRHVWTFWWNDWWVSGFVGVIARNPTEKSKTVHDRVVLLCSILNGHILGFLPHVKLIFSPF